MQSLLAVPILDECYPQMSCYSGHHSLEVHLVITSWLRPGQIYPTSWPLSWPGAMNSPPTWSLLTRGRGRKNRVILGAGIDSSHVEPRLHFVLHVLYPWTRHIILDSSFSKGISRVQGKNRVGAQLPDRFFCFLALLVDLVSGFTIP